MEGSLSYNAAVVLQALSQGHGYGFEIMRVAELPSGTVYPLLRRLEGSGLVTSRWEDGTDPAEEGRPLRRYYRVTAEGERSLAAARERLARQQDRLFGGSLEPG